MATTIKLKRTRKTDLSGITLSAGEPFYNLEKQQLFIGNEDGESPANKKHLTEITNNSTNSNTVSFYIGENINNKFVQTINNVNNANHANTANTAATATKALSLELDDSSKRTIDGVIFDGIHNIHHLFIISSKLQDYTYRCEPIQVENEATQVTVNLEIGFRFTVRWDMDTTTLDSNGLLINFDQGTKLITRNGSKLVSGVFEQFHFYEFMFTGESFELLGTAASLEDLDLTNYVTQAQLEEAINGVSASATLNWQTFGE